MKVLIWAWVSVVMDCLAVICEGAACASGAVASVAARTKREKVDQEETMAACACGRGARCGYSGAEGGSAGQNARAQCGRRGV